MCEEIYLSSAVPCPSPEFPEVSVGVRVLVWWMVCHNCIKIIK